jgi:hypothetical protein
MLRLKRTRWLLLLALIPVFYVCVVHVVQWQVREYRYGRTLERLREVLKPGMARVDVERYVRSKNFRFLQGCGSHCDTLTDFVIIGKEKPGWICIGQYIYAAFDYTATEPHSWQETRDSDRLTRVYPDRSDCLDLP